MPILFKSGDDGESGWAEPKEHHHFKKPVRPPSIKAPSSITSNSVVLPFSDANYEDCDYVITSSLGSVNSSRNGKQFNVTGLLPGTSYSFNVTAVSQRNKSTASTSSVSYITGPVPVTNITASSITTSSAILTYTTSNGSATSYSVSSNPAGATGTSTSNTMNVSGLLPGRSYIFTVTCSSGSLLNSAISATYYTPPVAISGITASNIGEKTLTLSYTTTNGNSTSYTVTSTPSGAIINSSIAGSMDIKGLTGGTSYTFTITATSNNVSVSTTSSSITTSAALNYSNDGSTITPNFKKSGTVVSTGSAIQITKGCYIFFTPIILTSIRNTVLQFSFYSDVYTYGELNFGCNSSGSGNWLRFSVRYPPNPTDTSLQNISDGLGGAVINNFSGITANYAPWFWDFSGNYLFGTGKSNKIPNNQIVSGFVSTWTTVRIQIDQNAVAMCFYNDVLLSSNMQLADYGQYFGFINGSSGGNYLYIKNIYNYSGSAPSNLTMSSITSSSFVLSYSASTISSPTYSVFSKPTGLTGSSSSTSMTVTNIAPGTNYYIGVMAVSDVRKVVSTSPLIYYSSPVAVTGISATTITSYSITLSYTTTNGAATTYSVITSPAGGTGTSNTNSLTVTNLNPLTKYTFTIVSTCNGVTANSATYDATTDTPDKGMLVWVKPSGFSDKNKSFNVAGAYIYNYATNSYDCPSNNVWIEVDSGGRYDLSLNSQLQTPTTYLNFTTAKEGFTIAFWYRAQNINGGNGNIYWLNTSGNGYVTNMSVGTAGWGITFSGNGGVSSFSASRNATSVNSGYNGADGNWHHYVVTLFSGGSSYVYLYYDNMLAGQSSVTGYMNPSNYNLGGGNAIAARTGGKFSDFRFYMRGLPSTDINFIYNKGRPQTTYSQVGKPTPYVNLKFINADLTNYGSSGVPVSIYGAGGIVSFSNIKIAPSSARDGYSIQFSSANNQRQVYSLMSYLQFSLPNFSPPFTVCFWINMLWGPAYNMFEPILEILTPYNTTTGQAGKPGQLILATDGGSLGGIYTSVETKSGTTVTTNNDGCSFMNARFPWLTWFHVAMVFTSSGGNNTVNTYYNGGGTYNGGYGGVSNSRSGFAPTMMSSTPGTYTFNIGYAYYKQSTLSFLNNPGFSGNINQFLVFNSALTERQIYDIFTTNYNYN